MSPEEQKTQKAWAFITASTRLCTEAYRVLEMDGKTQEIKTMEVAIDALLKVRGMVGRRVNGVNP